MFHPSVFHRKWSLNFLWERIWPYKRLTDGRGLLVSILNLFSSLLHLVHLAGFSVFHAVFPSLPSSKVPNQAAAGQSKLKSVSPSVPNYLCFLFQISLFNLISQAQFCLVSLFSVWPSDISGIYVPVPALLSQTLFFPPDSSTSVNPFSSQFLPSSKLCIPPHLLIKLFLQAVIHFY